MNSKRKIYMVSNHNLKEVHYGSTNDSISHSVEDLCRSENSMLAHWNWKTHEIECLVLAELSSPLRAQLKLRRHKTIFKRANGDWRVL